MTVNVWPGALCAELCVRVLEELDFVYWYPSTVIDNVHGGGYRSDVRTSQTAYSSGFTTQLADLIDNIEAHVCETVSVPRYSLQGWQALRYGVGTAFDIHHDDPDGSMNRVRSIVVVLHGADRGGELEFPNIDTTVPAQTGTVVSWVNRWPDGVGNRLAFHRVKPVRAGRRVSLVNWSSHPIPTQQGVTDEHPRRTRQRYY